MAEQDSRFISVTPMKNEGPFVLEWVAHNQAIGIDQMVVLTNDCSDGTDELLQRLDERGIVTHVDNNSRRKTSPQRRAFKQFQRLDIARPQDWILVIDADEHINVKTGDHTLRALTEAIPDARTISMTWRTFGNAGVIKYEDRFLTDQFHQAAREITRKPHQAWGMKTMFQRGLWDTLGVHRPKSPTVETMAECHWYNGSGQPMPERYFTGSWRSGRDSVGYDLVQVNHYALKSCDSYLVKKMRGRPNHTSHDMGLEYWNMMNLNHEEERSIDAIRPRKKDFYFKLLADLETKALHQKCCDLHRQKAMDVRALPDIDDLWAEMVGE